MLFLRSKKEEKLSAGIQGVKGRCVGCFRAQLHRGQNSFQRKSCLLPNPLLALPLVLAKETE